MAGKIRVGRGGLRQKEEKRRSGEEEGKGVYRFK